jgi:DnaJ-class molecular chaperone
MSMADNEAKNYYDLLGVMQETTQEEIHNTYIRFFRKIYPDYIDVPTKSEMSELNRAYDVLSDPQRKIEYDRYLYWNERLDFTNKEKL